MFSETRYALNGDLPVSYRTSREGPRDQFDTAPAIVARISMTITG